MRAAARRLAWSIAAPAALSACSLFLDFEELQGGGAGGAAAGGTGGSSASTGGGGAAGAGGGGAAGAGGGGSSGDAGVDASPCGECDDGDACTEDLCDQRGGGAVCRHYTVGVVEDGLSQTALGAEVHRVTLTANDRAFYGSVLMDRDDGAGGTVLDVQTFTFGPSGPDVTWANRLRDYPALSGFAPMSALALSASNVAPFEVAGWAAVLEPTSQLHAYRFRFDQSFAPQSAARPVSGSEFGDATGRLALPIAWRAGGEAYGAWIGPDGSITVDRPGVLPATLGSPGSPATALAPLLSADSRPGVLWFSGMTPYAQMIPQVGAPATATVLPSCSTASLPPPATYVTYDADTAFSTALPGLNFASWTSSNFTTAYATETQAVTATGSGAFSLSASDCDRQPALDTFNVVSEVVVRQGEPQILYEVTAVPRRHPSQPGVVQILLQVIRIDLDLLATSPKDAFRVLVPGDGFEVAAAPDATAPSLPALAVSGADRIGVVYRRDAPPGQPQGATLGRYRMCFATADDLQHPRPD